MCLRNISNMAALFSLFLLTSACNGALDISPIGKADPSPSPTSTPSPGPSASPSPLPPSAGWQETLESVFDHAETFDQLQDWTPGGQWYSASGCPTCASNATLPKKLDGSPSMWGIWNNKGLSFQYTPENGVFAIGDVITGSVSGTTATVRQVWNLDGKSYIQLTNTNAVQGTVNFTAGEMITSGAKTGLNLQWPLFIADHGPAYTWAGGGKSLVMDLGDNDNTNPSTPTMAGLGAQRMGTYFGDGVSGKSGYKKAHIFFMMKVAPTFFTMTDGSYDYVSVVKAFDLVSGFTDISTWGTPADRAMADPDAANYYRLDEYGLNMSVFNFGGGGASYPNNLFFTENIYDASLTGASLYTYTQRISSRKVRTGTTMDLQSYISSGEWFGVECASDIGTAGNNDGTTDFWIYDKNGVEKGHYSLTGERRLTYFDHYYNKMVLGGNRRSTSGATGSLDSRWWIDDLIIHGSRIGPTYFERLSGRGD